jgi:hypothetical protein
MTCEQYSGELISGLEKACERAEQNAKQKPIETTMQDAYVRLLLEAQKQRKEKQ